MGTLGNSFLEYMEGQTQKGTLGRAISQKGTLNPTHVLVELFRCDHVIILVNKAVPVSDPSHAVVLIIERIKHHDVSIGMPANSQNAGSQNITTESSRVSHGSSLTDS